MASMVTVWPAAITALSAGLGTEPPQVAAALQLPDATEVKVVAVCVLTEMLSIEAPGGVPVVLSLFQ